MTEIRTTSHYGVSFSCSIGLQIVLLAVVALTLSCPSPWRRAVILLRTTPWCSASDVSSRVVPWFGWTLHSSECKSCSSAEKQLVFNCQAASQFAGWLCTVYVLLYSGAANRVSWSELTTTPVPRSVPSPSRRPSSKGLASVPQKGCTQ